MLLFTHRNAVMFLLISICSTQLFMLKQITAACFTSDPAIPITYREKLCNYSYVHQQIVKTEISILCHI